MTLTFHRLLLPRTLTMSCHIISFIVGSFSSGSFSMRLLGFVIT